jgi:sugar diacid utilization regulator
LVIVTPNDRAVHPLARAAIQTAAPLVVAAARLERTQRTQDLAVRRAVADELIDVADTHESRLLAARSAALGVDIELGAVVVFALDPSGQATSDELLSASVLGFGSARVPLLATTRGHGWIGLVAGDIPDALLESALLAVGPAVRVGVGRLVTDPTEISVSFGDARLAAERTPRRLANRLIRYDDLDLGAVLINELPLNRLTPKIEAWLGPLRENELVYSTLRTYLQYDLDVGRTARALHLHPNSVRYRLSKAEQLIGSPLRSSSTIVALHVALLAAGS